MTRSTDALRELFTRHCPPHEQFLRAGARHVAPNLVTSEEVGTPCA